MPLSSTAETLADALRTIPRREGRGFTFLGPGQSKNFYSYEELYSESFRRAGHFIRLGLKQGDALALVCPDGEQFVLSFLGAVLAGVVPVPIFPRATFKDSDGYLDVVEHITTASQARVVLTQTSTLPLVEKLRERTDVADVVTVEECFDGSPPPFDPPVIQPDDVCFLQFTSGSTAKPKGVVVRHRNLVANARAFLGPSGLDRVDADVGVSWLPLYHDMGLIGFVLGTLICDIPVVLLPTASFARMPRLWLDTIHEHRGTITFAPNFAYQLVAKRLKDRDLERLDLSSLRVAGCGAEPIRAQTLRGFAKRLEPTGFSGDASYLPSYGMAEATLAITFHELGTPVRVDRVDPEALKRGHATPSRDESAVEFVGCGKPFPEHEVRVVNADGAPLGERRVGEIQTRGPSVTDGYFDNPEATRASYTDGWLRTGDLGYWVQGHLYLCGRAKDLLIINGANHFPQDIEWVVGDLDGVRRGNVAAIGVDRPEGEQLVVVAEAGSRDAERLRREILQTVVARFGLQPHAVVMVPVGTLPKTSSGKTQRRKTKTMYEDGALPEHP